MADNTVNHGTQKERDRLVLDVAWELDKIARTLPDLVPNDESQVHYLVRAFGGRMLRLVDVLYSVIQNHSDLPANGKSYEELKNMVSLGGCTQG